MRVIFTFCLVMFAVAGGAVLSVPPASQPGLTPNDITQFDNDAFINANRILMFVTNHGTIGTDVSGYFGYYYGTFFPYVSVDQIISGTNITSPMYAAGPWIGGHVNGDLRVAMCDYEDEYAPGPMLYGSFLPDEAGFRVYKLYSDSLSAHPNSDYLAWPTSQGAPVDQNGDPIMLGDQMLWTVYNDADPSRHNNHAGDTDPLGIEIKQTVFARSGPAPTTSDVLYLKYEFSNKGGNTVDDFFMSFWADPDVGGPVDDLVGCDTLDNLFYAYNADNDDSQYGYMPPAVGFKVLVAPQQVPGRLRMDAFSKYINGTDSDSPDETYCYMRGLTKQCLPYEFGGVALNYMHSGDPVTGAGDVDTDPRDKRMMASFGPYTFQPGEKKSLVLKMAVGQGSDRLSALTALRSTLNAFTTWPLQAGTSVEDDAVLPIGRATTTLFAGNLPFAFSVNDLDLSTVRVNGTIVPGDVQVLDSLSGYIGPVMRVTVRNSDLLSTYEAEPGTRTVPYTIDFSDPGGPVYRASGELSVMYIFIGDVNGDGQVDISDLTALVNYLFVSSSADIQLAAANLNCDESGSVDITDLTRLVNHLFVDQAPLTSCTTQ